MQYFILKDVEIMNIEVFEVIGLHGKYNYRILFEENSLILVAENGSGKTTIVNMFYYFLSRQWSKLNDYHFEKIIITIASKAYTFEKINYNELFLRDSKLPKRFTLRYREIIEEIINHYSFSDLRRNPQLMERLASQYNVPMGLIHELTYSYGDGEHRWAEREEIHRLEKTLNKILNGIQIVYLPTYRRIEKDLKNIFPFLEESMKEYEYRKRRRLNSNESSDYIELIEFGMDDVKERIEQRCNNLRSYFYNNLSVKITGSYLEDILNKRYKNIDSSRIRNFNDEALNYLLKRLDDNILSKEGKAELTRFVESVRNDGAISDEDKINAFFVSKLFQIYEEQQKAELDVNRFVNICNDYIKDGKHFEYNNDDFKVNIVLDDFNSKDCIDYKDLSSGEKQIVSLFSHLILNEKKYFIIIDEPELSLSVPWQERFLPDILASGNCNGILAVTHSPFIFKNNMKKYAHSLNEFLN